MRSSTMLKQIILVFGISACALSHGSGLHGSAPSDLVSTLTEHSATAMPGPHTTAPRLGSRIARVFTTGSESRAETAPPKPARFQSRHPLLDLSMPALTSDAATGPDLRLLSRPRAIGGSGGSPAESEGPEFHFQGGGAKQLVERFRREGLPVARLWETHSALLSLGLNQHGKPGVWLIQKTH